MNQENMYREESNCYLENKYKNNRRKANTQNSKRTTLEKTKASKKAHVNKNNIINNEENLEHLNVIEVADNISQSPHT